MNENIVCRECKMTKRKTEFEPLSMDDECALHLGFRITCNGCQEAERKYLKRKRCVFYELPLEFNK